MLKYTIRDLEKQFPTDAACLDWLRDYLYPNGIPCKVCRRVTKHHRVLSRRSYSCDYCGHHIHPTAGTIYHKSSTPLRLWFYAVYLMASTRCGISAKQLQRQLGVTYKTAWRMATQIRKILAEPIPPLTGEVEVDDAYIGGKQSGGKTGRGAPGKTPVLGIVERKGSVVARSVLNLKGRTVIPIIRGAVPFQGTRVYTDELPVYAQLYGGRYKHATVRHGDKEYARGRVHTNTVEGFWSQVKRSLHGTHHAIRPKYLQGYLNEYVFRWNHGRDLTPMFLTMLHRTKLACG